MKKFFIGALLMLATIASGEPLKLISPGAVGSTTDVAARVIHEVMQKRKMESVVLNKPGAGGVVGAAYAQDERHSLFVTSSAAMIISPLTLKTLPYDPATFTPIYNIGFVPNVLTLRKDFPASNMEEFIAYVIRNPGKVSIGVATARTAPDIFTRAFLAALELNMIVVPYTNRPPATGLVDVLGGRVDAFYGDQKDAAQFIKSGDLKVIMQSETIYPDVPLISKYAPLEGSGWLVLAVNGNIPAAWHQRLNKMLDADRDTFKEHFLRAGGNIADVQTIFRQQAAAWERAVKLAGIEKE